METFTPAHAAHGDLPAQRVSSQIALVVVGTVTPTLSAKVTVPMWPVQTSLQTLAALVIGATLGFRLGTATVLAYLAEGTAGLPVFQGTPE